jgi:glycine oxidase
MRPTYDVVILGGGVIGLSIARELAGEGIRVAVVERGEPGREASWAGAGILPPANRATASHPYDQLRGLSMELHATWAAQLREETGIDTGFSLCGGLYLARSPGEAAALRGMSLAWEDEQIVVERWEPARLAEAEPELGQVAQRVLACYWLPGEAQLRNPRHLRALVASCRIRGVELLSHCEVTGWRQPDDRLTSVMTSHGEIHADQFCLCAGAWTQCLLAELQLSSSILPIRGQMLLFRAERPPVGRILNEGSRYLVPRDDGHVLVGSTEEEAGFDKRTTEAGLAELRSFALALIPSLADAPLVDSWAGLRPATLDGFPYLGRIRGTSNGFIAAGHFRSGLYLSPGTAVVMSQLIRRESPAIDLAPFSLIRHGRTPDPSRRPRGGASSFAEVPNQW